MILNTHTLNRIKMHFFLVFFFFFFLFFICGSVGVRVKLSSSAATTTVLALANNNIDYKIFFGRTLENGNNFSPYFLENILYKYI